MPILRFFAIFAPSLMVNGLETLLNIVFMDSDFKVAFEKIGICVANLSCGVNLSKTDRFWLDCLLRMLKRFERSIELYLDENEL